MSLAMEARLELCLHDETTDPWLDAIETDVATLKDSVAAGAGVAADAPAAWARRLFSKISGRPGAGVSYTCVCSDKASNFRLEPAQLALHLKLSGRQRLADQLDLPVQNLGLCRKLPDNAVAEHLKHLFEPLGMALGFAEMCLARS